MSAGVGALTLRLGTLLLWVSVATFEYLRQGNLPFVGMVVLIVLLGIGRWRVERDSDTATLLLMVTGVAAVALL